MILVYFLIALTFSMVLTALFSNHISEKRRGDVFIGLFAAFMVLAWAADEWLIPALAIGLKASWLPVMTMIIFIAVLVLSLALSIRAPRLSRQTASGDDKRINVEAAAFDLLIWFGVFLTGISLIKAVGI